MLQVFDKLLRGKEKSSDPGVPLPDIYPRETVAYLDPRDIYRSIYWHTVCDRFKLETAQMSNHKRRINSLWHLHSMEYKKSMEINKLLLSFQKTKKNKKPDKSPKKHAKQEKPDKKNWLYVAFFHSYHISNLSKRKLYVLWLVSCMAKLKSRAQKRLWQKPRLAFFWNYKSPEPRSQVFSSLSSASNTGQTKDIFISIRCYGIFDISY